MHKPKRPLILLIIATLLVEFFAFIGFKTAIAQTGVVIFYVGISVYLLMTLAFWYTIFSFAEIRNSQKLKGRHNLLFLVLIGFFLGKTMVAIPTLIDFLRRVTELIIGYIKGNSIGLKAIPYSTLTAQIACGAGIFIWLLLLSGVRNRYRYRVKHLKLNFQDLPKAFSGLKIVQISDIHSGSLTNKGKVKKGIDLILKEKPDLILFTGDLVNNRAEEIEPLMDVFKRLTAPMGVYAIMGNHDYGDYINWEKSDDRKENITLLKKHESEMGWTLLDNAHVNFKRGDDTIGLLGVSNWSAKPSFKNYGSMPKTYAGFKPEKPSFKILMSHDPSHWRAEILKKYPDIQLTLSGHTHGMQFGISLPRGKRWSPSKYMYPEWGGLYREGSQMLYVNTGFGFLGYPGRVGILPEITVLELF